MYVRKLDCQQQPCVSKRCVLIWIVIAGKTHRELFSEFYKDLLQEPLEEALAVQPQPPASVLLFQQMMRDITTAGGVGVDPIQQVGSTSLATDSAMLLI